MLANAFRVFGWWVVKALVSKLVTPTVARDLVDAVFRLLNQCVDLTETDLDDELLEQLEYATDKELLAKFLAGWLEDRLPLGDTVQDALPVVEEKDEKKDDGDEGGVKGIV